MTTTTRHRFRLIDSAVQDGRRQIAYDAALTALHTAGRVPDTVRFLRFPPTVLVGRHQILTREVAVERCRTDGVGLVRRLSGGGAIYLDEGQVGWELVFDRATWPGLTLAEHGARICAAVALGLSKQFGIDARFRPRNDIEVDGRKISGTGGYFDGDTLVYQGTVLVDMDADRMARLVHVPAAKLARHGASTVAHRVVTLRELLGLAPPIGSVHSAILAGLSEGLGIEAVPGDITPDEAALTAKLHDEEIGTDAFVFGPEEFDASAAPVLAAERSLPGGTISVALRLDGPRNNRRISAASITGDFFVAPPRTIFDLEACLRGVPLEEIGQAIDVFFATTEVGMLSLSPGDIRDAVLAAVGEELP